MEVVEFKTGKFMLELNNAENMYTCLCIRTLDTIHGWTNYHKGLRKNNKGEILNIINGSTIEAFI